jgi:hypothetical protein
MSEIPNQGIKVSFAAVGAALHCVNAIPGTPFANDIEAADEAAAPFLRKQFEDEHPVLAVIERAREEGLWIELGVVVRGGRQPAWITLRRAVFSRAWYGLSLDECARELLANWPEGKS